MSSTIGSSADATGLSSSASASPTSYAPDLPASAIFAEKCWLQGALLSAVAYGVEVVLFFMCFYLLFTQSRSASPGIRHRRKNLPLLVYITTICVLGTLFMASLAEFTQLAFIENRNYPGGPGQYETDMFSIPIDEIGNVAFVLGNWFCDVLIVWRCMVIYNGCRFPLWIIMFFPCLIFLGSFTMGLLWLLQISASSPFESTSLNWTIPYFTLSLALNILLTLAIVARLLYYRHRVLSVLGPSHGSQYTSIAAMIVESAMLYSVFAVLFLVPFIMGSSVSQIFLQAMGQVQISATLLIVFRVAQGKGWSAHTQSSITTSSGKASSVAFNRQGYSDHNSARMYGSANGRGGSIALSKLQLSGRSQQSSFTAVSATSASKAVDMDMMDIERSESIENLKGKGLEGGITISRDVFSDADTASLRSQVKSRGEV